MTKPRPVWIQALHQVCGAGEEVEALWLRMRSLETALDREVGHDGEPRYIGRISHSSWLAWKEALKAEADRERPDLSMFETLVWRSLHGARKELGEKVKEVPWILSTTKGNIGAWREGQDERARLFSTAKVLADHFEMKHRPTVVSHACVSGLLALILAQRWISTGQADQVLVTGADLVSEFILRGFQSFHALSLGPCRPFDHHRNGISLGEGAATLLLSAQVIGKTPIELVSGASTNDANHLSGPSRTGEELAMAIERCLTQAGVSPKSLDMISAHGTASVYNDEMEAKALGMLGLVETPVHSLKGLVGHTLGAAGVLETAIVLEAMERQQRLPSLGYKTPGVSYPLAVTETLQSARLDHVLKTGSGFGGVNAAILLRRHPNRPINP